MTTATIDPPVPETADHAPLLERAFFGFEPREGSYFVERIDGELPAWLRGAYYLNGPGRSERGELRYRHWLDGDGMVSALHFSDEGVRFTHRFVAGTKFREEEAAGRALYRAFGTAFDGDRLVRGIALASPLNVSVYPFAGTVLAFGEQGLPWELDPATLETRGEHTFGRRLNGISPFAAHPCVDPESGELWNFGTSFSATRPLLHLYRFTAAGVLAERFRVALDAPRSVHDFALSPRYAVFYLSPYVLDMGTLADGATLLDALAWEPERGSRLLLVSRANGEPAAEVEIGCGYCLHLIGAFEDEGRLTVDVLELDRPVYDQYEVPDLFPGARIARPVRYVVDVKAGAVLEKGALDYRSMCDFPAIDPRRAMGDYGDFWMLGIAGSDRRGRKFFDQLVHCDWHEGRTMAVWQAPEHCYLGGEPVFLPEPGNAAGGYVICQQFDAAACASAFLLFDAFDVAAGPRAVLHLREPVRLGFHAAFEPAAS